MKTCNELLVVVAVSALLVASVYATLGFSVIRALQHSVSPGAATEQMIERFGR